MTLARRRSYSLLDGSTFIVVNHTVRLDGLQFTAAKGGPQRCLMTDRQSTGEIKARHGQTERQSFPGFDHATVRSATHS